VTTGGAVGDIVAAMLARPRYEIIPIGNVEEQVAEHVPYQVTLTVTASPSRGIDATLAAAERLAGAGYRVVPHLSARLIRDDGHLREILQRLGETGLDDVFVVAGDAHQPAGEFEGAAPLLRSMAKLGHRLEEIGITGYPESHPFISDDATIEAMFAKAEHATYITSQICFDSHVTVEWIEAVWNRGTRLPIHIGMPGVVGAVKLLRVSSRIGLGDSARFLRRHSSWLARLVLPGAYRPDRLIHGLEPGLGGRERRVAGFHFFTFNEVAETERWRRAFLERLGSTAAQGGAGRLERS
jgi:methylenetetrahydrofolate reductase (NADPH)